MPFSLPSKNPKPLKCGMYKTDGFNFNRILQIKVKNRFSSTSNIYVRNWNEAFALHGGLRQSKRNKRQY